MPIYEYECNKCGHRFEQLVRSDTRPECPECHSRSLKKQFSAFAVGSQQQITTAGDELCGRCGNVPGSCAMNS